jgi:hypothetical protein
MANSNAAPALPETHERVISAMAGAWRRPPLIGNRSLRWALAVGASIYLTVAITSLEINWLRIYQGLERGSRTPRIVSHLVAPRP